MRMHTQILLPINSNLQIYIPAVFGCLEFYVNDP
jgi:hypothetical protein